MEVSRGSQFQYDPQLNFAQTAPVTVARRQNMNPSPAAAEDLTSSVRFLDLRYRMPYTMLVRNAITLSQAVGTWKKMILAFCSRAGITGISYHCVGCGTIGIAIPATITPAIN